MLRTKTTVQMSNALAASLGNEHVEPSFNVPLASLLQTIFTLWQVLLLRSKWVVCPRRDKIPRAKSLQDIRQ